MHIFNILLNIHFLTFIGPCIANIFAEYNQKYATFHDLFISVRRSTCFRRVFRPSSGAQNCTHSVRHLSDQYCYLPLARLADPGRSQPVHGTATYKCYDTRCCAIQFWPPDDERI